MYVNLVIHKFSAKIKLKKKQSCFLLHERTNCAIDYANRLCKRGDHLEC